MAEQKGGVLCCNDLGLYFRIVTKFTDQCTTPILIRENTINSCDCFICFHTTTRSRDRLVKDRAQPFSRALGPVVWSTPGAWLAAYTPAQMNHTNPENGPEEIRNELVRCESTPSSGVLSVFTEGVSAADFWEGLKRKLLVPFSWTPCNMSHPESWPYTISMVLQNNVCIRFVCLISYFKITVRSVSIWTVAQVL